MAATAQQQQLELTIKEYFNIKKLIKGIPFQIKTLKDKVLLSYPNKEEFNTLFKSLGF